MFGRNESTVFKVLKSEVQVVTIGQTVVFDRTWIHLELNKNW